MNASTEGLLLGIVIFIIFLFYASCIHIESYSIDTDKIANDKKIVLISDYHMGRTKWHDQEVLKKIKKISPDIILVAGDLITTYPAAYYGVRNNYQWADRIGNLLFEMAKCSKVYVIDGNHEAKLKMAFSGAYMPVVERYERIIEKNGAVFLHNSSVKIDNDLILTGLELEDNNYDKTERVLPTESTIRKSIGVCSSGYNVLLTHTPEFFDLYDTWGADLVLCGHMHGGIIRFGSHGLVGPDRKLFPKYAYGKYVGTNSLMIVTSGIGEHTIPIRFFNPKEIVFIELKGRGRKA